MYYLDLIENNSSIKNNRLQFKRNNINHTPELDLV